MSRFEDSNNPSTRTESFRTPLFDHHHFMKSLSPGLLLAGLWALLFSGTSVAASPPNPLAATIGNPPNPNTPTPLPTPDNLKRTQDVTVATADDLINGYCADVVLLFARGTNNPGNIGSTLGRPLFEAMEAGLEESVIAQGVLPYPATKAGFLCGGSRTGVKSMVRLTFLAVRQCPKAKIVLAGFRFVSLLELVWCGCMLIGV